MRKSILVIDTPESCKECPLMYWSICGEACKVTRSSVSNVEEKPLWCPLRPLPQRYDEDVMREQKGWNACLDEITGETE